MIRKVSAPLRIDICGGSLDIPPIPAEMGPIHIVSAAINHRVTGTLATGDDGGLVLDYKLPPNIKTGSGLGSSGCMNLVWLTLVTGSKDRHWLANSVFEVEKATGVVGGTQDQYTAAYGGINLLKMSHDRVWVIPILRKEDPAVKLLEEHMMIVDSGITRSATSMNDQFIQRYKKGELYNELNQLNILSVALYDELVNLNITTSNSTVVLQSISRMLSEEWRIRKILMPSNTDEIDKIISDIGISLPNSNKMGSRVMGAAGGGCILLLVPESRNVEVVRDRICQLGLNIIDIEFDFTGIVISEEP